MAPSSSGTRPYYMPFLLFISGMGGLLAGVDFGIIGSALDFLNKTIQVTEGQLSFIVAIYTGGGILASLFAGLLADWIGRKKMMVLGGLAFLLSILLIYTSQGFVPLLIGRILMGLSGGIICVVVPLYMAECLAADIRGRGTALFQFMLTLGIAAAAAIGVWFTRRNGFAIEEAQERFASDPAALKTAVLAANNAAWRYMFLVAAAPGLIYMIGALFVKESPRWLFRRCRTAEAETILRLSRGEAQAKLELLEMDRSSTPVTPIKGQAPKDSLFQRRYVVPFIIACIVLSATQATGINSVIAFAVVILKQAGLDSISASWGYQSLTIINCVMTLGGAALIDRKGRKFLLKVGTLGIILTLISGALVFRSFESEMSDVDVEMRALVRENKLELDITRTTLPNPGGRPMQLSILSAYGDKQQVSRAFMPTPGAIKTLQAADAIITALPQADRDTLAAADPLKKIGVEELSPEQRTTVFGARKIVASLTKEQRKTLANAEQVRESQVLSIAPEPKNLDENGKPFPLEIKRAKFGPIPSPATGWLLTGILCLFVTFFATGPGVCVWLALTELLPTRIRSTGMGVAMVLNNGVQFLIALAFLPVVGYYGFHAMFFIWAGCTVVYFITAAFIMPETKGKTLEEIEDHFAGKPRG